MTTPTQDPARVTRRRRKHERQAVIFGLLITFLVVLGLGAAAVYTDTISNPFPQPIYTKGSEIETLPPPCLPVDPDSPDGVLPVASDRIGLRIFNADDFRAPIASAHAAELERRGFDVRESGNWTRQLPEIELRFGITGIDRAYTVAAHYPMARLIMDDRPGRVVDIVVGENGAPPIPVEELTLSADTPLTNIPGCVPAEELTPVPREYGYGRDPEADDVTDDNA